MYENLILPKEDYVNTSSNSHSVWGRTNNNHIVYIYLCKSYVTSGTSEVFACQQVVEFDVNPRGEYDKANKSYIIIIIIIILLKKK